MWSTLFLNVQEIATVTWNSIYSLLSVINITKRESCTVRIFVRHSKKAIVINAKQTSIDMNFVVIFNKKICFFKACLTQLTNKVSRLFLFIQKVFHTFFLILYK